MFRSGSKQFDVAEDCIRRGDFAGGSRAYAAAATKLAKEGDASGSEWATALSEIYSINWSDSQTLLSAAAALASFKGQQRKVGVREIAVDALSAELEIQCQILRAMELPSGSTETATKIAEVIRAAGLRMQREVQARLLVSRDLFNFTPMKGTEVAATCFAQAEELLGDVTVDKDPKAAAEHCQNAVNYWGVVGTGATDRGRAQEKVRRYSLSVKCWFCGRESMGEMVNFQRMPAHLSEYILTKNPSGLLPAADPSADCIYACTNCHSAVTICADAFAQQRAQEVHDKLEREIEELRRALQARR